MDKQTYKQLVLWIGTCLYGSEERKLVLVVCGPYATAKTTLFRLLRRVLGEFYGKASNKLLVSKPRDPDVNSHTAGFIALKGKRLVVMAEMPPNSVVNHETVSLLTGEEDVPVRECHGKDFYDMPNPCHLAQQVNGSPILPEGNEDIIEKFFMMEMSRVFDKKSAESKAFVTRMRQREFINKFLTYAAICAREVVEKYGEDCFFDPPSNNQELFDKYRCGNDKRFMQDYIGAKEAVAHPAAEWFIPSTEIWKVYEWWCPKAKKTPVSKDDFFKELTARYGKSKEKRREQWSVDKAMSKVNIAWNVRMFPDLDGLPASCTVLKAQWDDAMKEDRGSKGGGGG